MPKQKADNVQIIRFEFQETERDALNLYVASNAVKNVVGGIGEGVGSVIAPFANMTVTSGLYFGSLIGLVLTKIAVDMDESGRTGNLSSFFINSFGPVLIYDFAKNPQAAIQERIGIMKNLGGDLKGWIANNIQK